MNFKDIHVGDQVMIADRDTLTARSYHPNVVSEMLNYACRVVTVTRLSPGISKYVNIAEDGGCWNWPVDALQPVVLEEIAQPDVEEFTSLLSTLYGA